MFSPLTWTRRLSISALIPALVLGTGSAAVAAANTLTLTVLNRAGAKVALSTTVVDTATGARYTIRTGTPKKLPRGGYAVLASITSGGATTLGGGTVKVSGATRLTIDARKGKRVTLAVTPAPAGLETTIDAQVCTPIDTSYNVEAVTSGSNPIYVIPNSSKNLSFGALGSWTDLSGKTDSYAIRASTTGVPSNPARILSRSKLATVTVASRRGPTASESTDVAVQPIQGGCGDYLYSELWSSTVPTSAKVHLSAGSWIVRTDAFSTTKSGASPDIGGFFTKHKFAAGKAYGVPFYNAAWGPGTMLPVTLNGRLWFGLDSMFMDPVFPDAGGEGGDKGTATLTLGGKTVAVKKDPGWVSEAPMLVYTVKKAGWYTLTDTASRYYPEITFPAGMLSTRTSVTYRFYAKPKSYALAQVYSIQMRPGGLDGYNRAKPGSTTSVPLKLNRLSQDPDAKRGANPKVKTVTAKMSADGGKTWRTVPVKKINGTWTAIVTNPASGAVSLRARAAYTSGGYTDVTIIRAYGIS